MDIYEMMVESPEPPPEPPMPPGSTWQSWSNATVVYHGCAAHDGRSCPDWSEEPVSCLAACCDDPDEGRHHGTKTAAPLDTLASPSPAPPKPAQAPSPVSPLPQRQARERRMVVHEGFVTGDDVFKVSVAHHNRRRQGPSTHRVRYSQPRPKPNRVERRRIQRLMRQGGLVSTKLPSHLRTGPGEVCTGWSENTIEPRPSGLGSRRRKCQQLDLESAQQQQQQQQQQPEQQQQQQQQQLEQQQQIQQQRQQNADQQPEQQQQPQQSQQPQQPQQSQQPCQQQPEESQDVTHPDAEPELALFQDVKFHEPGRKYRTKKENETVKTVAKQFGLPAIDLLRSNIRRQRHIQGWDDSTNCSSRLKKGTWLLLPASATSPVREDVEETRRHGSNRCASSLIHWKVTKRIGWNREGEFLVLLQDVDEPCVSAECAVTHDLPNLKRILAALGYTVEANGGEAYLGKVVLAYGSDDRPLYPAEVVGHDPTMSRWFVLHLKDNYPDEMTTLQMVAGLKAAKEAQAQFKDKPVDWCCVEEDRVAAHNKEKADKETADKETIFKRTRIEAPTQAKEAKKSRQQERVDAIDDVKNGSVRRRAMIELFCGKGTVSKAFHDKGWIVFTLDKYTKARDVPWSEHHFEDDIFSLDEKWLSSFLRLLRNKYGCKQIDFCWASPCCNKYSRASTTEYDCQRRPALEQADKMVEKTFSIIHYFMEKHEERFEYVLENPQTGKLKERSLMLARPYIDVSYCLFGAKVQKHTRLWTNAAIKQRMPKPHFCRRDASKPYKNMCGQKHVLVCGGSGGSGEPGLPRDERAAIPRGLIDALYKALYE